jgi:multidrug efflux pump subunit AcrA (membrane-fusion protein)
VQLSRASRRWLAGGAAAVVLAGGGTAVWALTRSSPASAAATANLVAAGTSDLSQTVTTTGTIQPRDRADLTFGVSGRVTSVPVSVGQKVGKGDLLATVDSTTLRTAVDTASAAVTAAEQQVASLSGATSTQLASAEAQLAQARSDLATAQDDLSAASLTAPFSGVVAAVGLATGDVVGSSSAGAGGGGGGSSTATSKAITVISTDAWVVDAGVGSADLAQLKKGLQAQITPTGSRALVFGTVASLGILATSSTSGSATFPVVIAVTGSPAGLYAGATADVTIIVKRVTGVLTVPTLAVATESGRTVVHQVVGGKRVSTPVTTGTVYGPLTQITSGLKAGDEVVVTFARPGGTGTRRGTGGRTGGPGGVPGGGFGGNG